MTRAVMPADHLPRPEPMTPERAAQALYDAGHRSAFLGATDGQIAIAIARSFPPDVRLGDTFNSASAYEAVRYHLRRICAAAIAAPFDPEHIAALKAEARNCARPTRHVRRAESEGAK
ncbi:hypothetical protein MKK84_32840 [Methylobacterium sp. E-065]|uniref:hypothetical protein n=1 Tax=Methylobacterium sp. E-065 TaxID=2836583 RepID=UPI001FB96AA4|nr:hypothetical protein [Methylobacterium sp. E-065]MCJ2022136.1 hypothetical protein [Methylobacterium sp. E-065]